MQIGGPTHELPPQEISEKKFMGRSRLYIGNLTNDTTPEEITQLFQPYGESTELFINKEKNFAFVKMVISSFNQILHCVVLPSNT